MAHIHNLEGSDEGIEKEDDRVEDGGMSDDKVKIETEAQPKEDGDNGQKSTFGEELPLAGLVLSKRDILVDEAGLF